MNYRLLVLTAFTLLLSGCGVFGELDWGARIGGLKITYDLNGGGGTVPLDSNTYSKGTRVTAQTAPADGTPPAGAVSFYGWSTSPDGYGNFHAADSAWTITESTTLYALWQGDGTTPLYPKLGSTKNDLLNLGQNDNFALVSDVDGMDAMLFPGSGFTGTFDGRGHTITLDITQSADKPGLFKFVSGTALIKNLHISGSISTTVVNAQDLNLGGIVGLVMSGSNVQIINCMSSVNVNLNGTVNRSFCAGGILGAFSGTVSIKNCYAAGNITGNFTSNPTGTIAVGGIAGGKTSTGVPGVLTIENSVSLSQTISWTTTVNIASFTNKALRFIGGHNAGLTTVNNYTLPGTVTLQYNTSTVHTQSPNADMDGIPAALADIESETWWRNTAGWEAVWGGNNPTLDKPWVWDAAAKRPKLHKFD